MLHPSGTQIELVLGDQRAVVVEVGGGLRAYSAAGRDILDGYGVDAMSTSGRGQVLIPWPNRVQDGSYVFDGRRHQLPIDDPQEQDAIHGLVRWAAWTVGEREPHRVVMEHVLHPQPGYPFSLELGIEYRLSERGLSVRVTATNRGTRTCPYASGAHPYLTLGSAGDDSLILRAPGRTVLRSDARGIPTGSGPVGGTEYDFRQPRPIGTTKLDHAFTDLERDEDGVARVELTDPAAGTGVTLWVDESYGYLMLFTGDALADVARRSLAVEPMTCPPNAFRSGESVLALEPGQTVTSTWGIAPSPQRDLAIPQHKEKAMTDQPPKGDFAAGERAGRQGPPRDFAQGQEEKRPGTPRDFAEGEEEKRPGAAGDFAEGQEKKPDGEE